MSCLLCKDSGAIQLIVKDGIGAIDDGLVAVPDGPEPRGVTVCESCLVIVFAKLGPVTVNLELSEIQRLASGEVNAELKEPLAIGDRAFLLDFRKKQVLEVEVVGEGRDGIYGVKTPEGLAIANVMLLFPSAEAALESFDVRVRYLS